jgi:heavy metal translocating P-type ATPase
VLASVEGRAQRFCCYGCALALQITRARGDSGAAATILIRLGLAIFFAINVMMVSMPAYVPYVYGAEAVSNDGPLFQVLRVLAAILAAPVLALLGWPICAGAVRGLRAGSANSDALIVLGTCAAYGLSVVNTLSGRGAVYFDTAAMLLVLVTLGRYLEAHAKAEAGAAIRARLAPAPALATRVSRNRAAAPDRDGAIEAVDPDGLEVGDAIRVGPGEAFPTDGIIVEGVGAVDEAALTGESRAVGKEPGSRVASGTCSIDGIFRVRVTAPAAASAAARIAALIDHARRERAPAERVADRVAGVLTPVVLVIAIAAGIGWTLRAGAEAGVLTGLAVLVVACPCGLGIATPVAFWTALVTAARRGVIVRTAAALERAADLRDVLFDKTGTLTDCEPRLVAVEPASDAGLDASELLAIAAALESGLTHPLARAIAAAWAARPPAKPAQNADLSLTLPDAGREPLHVSAVRVMPGRGVSGVVEGRPITIGSPRLAQEELGEIATGLRPSLDGADAAAFVWTGGTILGALGFAEALRPESAETIDRLRRLGVHVGLVSGDRAAAVLVPSLIDPADAAVNLLPADKLAHLRAVRRRPGTRASAIAMVGDGINDAPALAAADVGMAVGDATDLARLTADVAIVSNDLRGVPWLIAHARRVRRVARQNLFWAFAYNAGALAMAAAGALTPLVAALAMLASSLAVVANARRLRRA